MAKKKSHPAASTHKPTPAKKSARPLWIAGVIALVVVGGIWAATSLGSKSTSSASGAPANEQKYIGRLLPAGYQEPKIADVQVYASTVKMTDVAPTQNSAGISIPADKVVSSKIVYFEYKKASGDTIPMIAYVKPSGKLFVGVSYCPPCQGKRDRIEAGGTLVCETCGTVRNLETGVGISGGCRLYPLDELPASVSGGKITVTTAAIDSWTPQPLDRPSRSQAN
jgi:nitrite reductase/ring-hydroxylating ferredoxin subunit